MALPKAYDEVVDFIAAGTTPQNVVSFRPSEATLSRVRQLLHLQKNSRLSPEESQEMDDYLRLEHIMRLVKARAKRYISTSES